MNLPQVGMEKLNATRDENQQFCIVHEEQLLQRIFLLSRFITYCSLGLSKRNGFNGKFEDSNVIKVKLMDKILKLFLSLVLKYSLFKVRRRTYK